jgi:hypothetical protein
VVNKKKDKDTEDTDSKKFLGTGAAGDPENPEAGAPGTQFAQPVEIEINQTEQPKAKDEK